MADTIAVMNGGRIEQLGRADGALRAPADGVRRGLPRQVEPAAGARSRARAPSGSTTARSSARRRTARHGPSRSASGRRRSRSARAARTRSAGAVRETRLHRRRDRVRRRDGRRATSPSSTRTPRPAGSSRRSAAQVDVTWRPSRPSSSTDQRRRRNDAARLTRRELLRRGAAGARCSRCPGLLAACGRAAARNTSTQVNDALRFSNWPLYIDYRREDEAATDARPVHEEDGHQGRLLRGHQRQRVLLRRRSRAALAGPVDRPRHHRHHRQLALPGAARQQGLGREARQGRDPELREPDRRAASPPSTRTATYSLPWQSGMTGIAWNEDVDGPGHVGRPAARRPEAEGQGDAADRDGRLGRARDARERRRPLQGRPTRRSTRRSTGSRRRVDSGQIRRFTGNDYAQPLTKGDLAAAVAWSGDVVQLLADNPNLQWAIPKAGRRCSGRTTCSIPLRRQRRDGVDVHELRLRPEDRRPDRRLRQLRDAGQGRREALAKTDPETAKNPLIFPTDDMLAQLHAVRRRRAQQPGLHRGLAEGARRMSCRPVRE